MVDRFDQAGLVSSLKAQEAASISGGEKRIRTMQEMRTLERENILMALEATGWLVSGDGGAARLLGMPPSTLGSRMKTLGITKPHE